jgi:predicted short-subunit dehydrogenase-like oxidoreductase (DUF2520 family)
LASILSIIGGGHVGRTLGRLWADNGIFRIGDVLTRSPASAARAAAFIGAGRAIDDYSSLQAADVYMITTPDDQLASSCAQLAASGRLRNGVTVFHCSGARQSRDLSAAAAQGAAVASIHPIRSFAAPENVVRHFAGTYCGSEGDPAALAVLEPAFHAIGAVMVPIHADSKVLYHAGAVFASNYLSTLLGVAQDAYGAAGIPPDTALKLMEPLVRECIDNIFRLGPAAALSGPIARGDMATVQAQQRAVASWSASHGDLYTQFIPLTVALAAGRNKPAEQD